MARVQRGKRQQSNKHSTDLILREASIARVRRCMGQQLTRSGQLRVRNFGFKEPKVRLRHRCNPEIMHKVNSTLSKFQMDMIEASPFKYLLKMQTFGVNGPLLRELVGRWVEDAQGFCIGGRIVKFSPYEVALFLGLRIKGEQIDVQREYGTSKTHEILHSQFGKYDVTCAQIVEALTKFQNEDSKEDFFCLYITLSFGSFFFPLSNGYLLSNFLQLLDNPSKRGDYAWGKAVYDLLIDGINRASKCLIEKRNVMQLHLTGCAVVLQIWALEHLRLYERPTATELSFPRFFAWEGQRMLLRKLHAQFESEELVQLIMPTDEELQHDVLMEARDVLEELRGGLYGELQNRMANKGEKKCRQSGKWILAEEV